MLAVWSNDGEFKILADLPTDMETQEVPTKYLLCFIECSNCNRERKGFRSGAPL